MSATLSTTLPRTGTWEIDPIHSTARFSLTHHAIATFRAGFDAISGAFDGERGVLAGSVPVENIDLQGVARFKEHLLAERFFDSENHPTLSFGSEELSASPEGALSLSGELTIRGVTRPITATGAFRGPITVRHNDGHVSDRIAIDLATVIDRREFGMTHNNELAEGVLNLGWDVTVEVALELVLA